LNVGFREKLELLSNKFDSLSLCTVHNHDIGFDLMSVALIDFMEELVDYRPFSRARRTVKDNMGNFVLLMEIVEFGDDFLVNRKKMYWFSISYGILHYLFI
jgi:hypothetical protein